MTRQERNSAALKQLHPVFRPKVIAVISDLEGHGWRPLIPKDSGWRSRARQAELKAEGHSTVTFSFHCAFEPGGIPASLAADVVDERHLWDLPDDHLYWKHLGSSARAHKLIWGGAWRNFPDRAHIQLLPNTRLASIRAATRAGRPLPVG